MIEPQDFLLNLVKGIVEKPDEVKVEKTVDDMGVLLTLDVNPDDMGQVIGRQGATAEAIRTLVRACGMHSNMRVSVRINDPKME